MSTTLEEVQENPLDFDVSSAEFDHANGNFSDGDDYLWTTLIQDSFTNGQLKQAQEYCNESGLDYAEQYREFMRSRFNYT